MERCGLVAWAAACAALDLSPEEGLPRQDCKLNHVLETRCVSSARRVPCVSAI